MGAYRLRPTPHGYMLWGLLRGLPCHLLARTLGTFITFRTLGHFGTVGTFCSLRTFAYFTLFHRLIQR